MQSRVGGKRTTPTSKTNMSKEPNHGQQDAETRKYIKRCVISMENFEGSEDMERGTLPLVVAFLSGRFSSPWTGV
jgi:hypothetical protein